MFESYAVLSLMKIHKKPHVSDCHLFLFVFQFYALHRYSTVTRDSIIKPQGCALQKIDSSLVF